ncbi:MAG: hypothetical protein DRJ05_16255 [Bacteroidetes bacterium]|nr:MAG: hypothetical protein DRJ05_16255 [Bacteroidota bacterium]
MTRFYKIAILVFIVAVFNSCSINKVATLAKQGSVTEKVFLKQIPFVYYNDLIFVEVVIDEIPYSFFIDTGAELNVIGKHVISNIDYKVITKANVTSTSKTKQNLEFIELPKIAFSNIVFYNTGAIIADLSHFNKFFGCRQIDGIIGNNLMRKANWQIDYQNNIITITDNAINLKVSDKAHKIPMGSRKWGSIYLDGVIDGVKSKFTFDTGFTGNIKSDKKLFESLQANDKDLDYVTETGEIGAGLHGKTIGSTYKTYAKSIDIEGVKINNQILSLEKNSSSLVGNGFFENFIITIDWGNDILFLDPVKDVKADTLKGYELILLPNYLTNKIEIRRQREGYHLGKDINLDGEIIKINDIDVSNFTSIELCEFWEGEKNMVDKDETLELEILNDGEKRILILTEKQLLPK